MDMEIEGPIDDVEALFAEEDVETLGDAGPGSPSNHPLAC